MKIDIHDLQDRIKNMEAQLAKVIECQTLMLTQFVGEPKCQHPDF
jgi:hypothetical protein